MVNIELTIHSLKKSDTPLDAESNSASSGVSEFYPNRDFCASLFSILLTFCIFTNKTSIIRIKNDLTTLLIRFKMGSDGGCSFRCSHVVLCDCVSKTIKMNRCLRRHPECQIALAQLLDQLFHIE